MTRRHRAWMRERARWKDAIFRLFVRRDMPGILKRVYGQAPIEDFIYGNNPLLARWPR